MRSLFRDAAGTLWVGTDGRGLYRVRDGRLLTEHPLNESLAGASLGAIYEDRGGSLWVGAGGGRGSGGRPQPPQGRPLRARHDRQGLFDNVVSRILEDGRGNLWMSGNRGVFRVGRRELNDLADGRAASVNCISYGVADGMKSNETNGGGQPAGWKGADGSLWFPTIRGVVRIDPDNLNPLPPPVHIEQVLVGKTPADPRRPVEVRPGGGDLEIHYTGISLAAPEKVRFRYKLEGYDADWVEAGGRRVAFYTNTPPGRYVFRVMAANNDGVWSAEGAAVSVVVVPPFWRTWWLVGCAAAAVALAAFLLYRRRIARVERARRAQEEFSRQLIASQEGERKRIAAELHDSLGQDLLIIKNRAALGLRLLDDPARAREQIEQIAGTASQSIREVRQIAYNLRPYQLDEIGLTQALEELVERVAGSCPVRLSASIDYIDDLLPADSAINLYRIIQEAINNVVKHSGAGAAAVTVRRGASEIEATVEDDGKGFAPAPREGGGAGRGLGLVGLAERARILGGKLAVRSAPGRGTTVRLTIRTRGVDE